MGIFVPMKKQKLVYEWAKSSSLFVNVKRLDHKTGDLECGSAKYWKVGYLIVPTEERIRVHFYWDGTQEDAADFADNVEKYCAHAVKTDDFLTFTKGYTFIWFELIGNSSDFIDTIQTRIKEFEADFAKFCD